MYIVGLEGVRLQQFHEVLDGVSNFPRISTDLSARTKWRRAISRVAPDAKICPNCESANSWMPPFAPDRKVAPDVPRRLELDPFYTSGR